MVNKQSTIRRGRWIGLLFLTLLMSAQRTQQMSHTPTPTQAAQASGPQAGSVDGMVVVRDAVTGELRAPTPEEWARLQLDSPQPRSDRQPVAIRRRDGTLTVIMPPGLADYSVAQRAPDGKLRAQCQLVEVGRQPDLSAPIQGEIAGGRHVR